MLPSPTRAAISGRRPSGSRPAVAALAVLTAALALSGCAATGPDTSPAGTVERFVTQSSVLGNGYRACTYLTAAEQHAVAARAGADESCRQALDAGGLVVGGETIDSVHALHRLKVRTWTDGDRARVRLSSGGAAAEFDVVRAHGVGEVDEFEAPDTGWRIARGALELLHAPAHLTAIARTGALR